MRCLISGGKTIMPASKDEIIYQKRDCISRIEDENLLEKICIRCPNCGTNLVLAKDWHQKSLLKKLAKKTVITGNILGYEKSKVEIHKRLMFDLEYIGIATTKASELELPVEFVYEYTINKCDDDYFPYRVQGVYRIYAGEKFRKILRKSEVAENMICSCCGVNISDARVYIEEQKKIEYDKLIEKYINKKEEKNIEVNLAEFDVKNYLGTLIELRKDSFIVENQIKDLITKKYECKKMLSEPSVNMLG